MLNAPSSIYPVRLRDFFRDAADITISVDDSRVYRPDAAWTKTFAAGLQTINFFGQNVVEVGVGSGVNMLGLITCARPPASFIGVDITREAVEDAAKLVQGRANISLRQSDLLSAIRPDEAAKLNSIIACIPQVPMHRGEIASERDKSDYYEETGIKEDVFGLGLNARLVDQAKKIAPQAELVLNIAGRPGMERIDAMFKSRGCDYRIHHQALVQQDAGTCLRSLCEIEEKTGLPFHFFADPDRSKEIKACEAEDLRQSGVPIYHNLYVLRVKLG